MMPSSFQLPPPTPRESAPDVFLVSATGCLPTEQAPVGGGVRIAEQLLRTLAHRLPLHFLTPGLSRGRAQRDGFRHTTLPLHLLERRGPRALLDLPAWRYARFSREFEAASTQFLFQAAPRTAPRPVVLVNDVAEGPDFERLRLAGFKLVTLFHVVVAEFFTRFYLRGLLSARRLQQALWTIRKGSLNRLVPLVLRFAFQKERAAVEYSHRLVVPSRGMADALLHTYPHLPRERLAIIPWDRCPEPPDAGDTPSVAETRGELPGLALEPGEQVVATLSRFSPEKGLELLLEATRRLVDRPKSSGRLRSRLHLVLCGEAAYMGGKAYEARLRERARRIRGARISFPGYQTGRRKQALLERAELFVSCSHYEAYGLSIAEALAAGTPVLSTDHYGAREVLRPQYGRIVTGRHPDRFAQALAALLNNDEERRRMAVAAREAFARRDFSRAAGRLEAIIRNLMTSDTRTRHGRTEE